MRRLIVVAGFCGIVGHASAQQPAMPTGIGVANCIFADRAFSSGAYLCVAKSMAVTCLDGRWTPQRSQPCDHDLDPFKPTYGK